MRAWFLFLVVVVSCSPMALPQSATEVSFRAVQVGTLATLEGGAGGLTVGQDGTIYSSEFGNWAGPVPEGETRGGSRVFAVSPSGKIRVVSRSQRGASGSAWSARASLLQANIGGNTISEIDLKSGEVTPLVTSGLTNPVGLELDRDGALWVANCGGQSLVRVASGESREIARSPLFKCPNGITLAGDGHLYVSNFFDGSVLRVTHRGEVSLLATVPGNNNGHLIYAHGALWVAARGAHQIARVTLDGQVSMIAGSGEQGGVDGAPDEARFSLPNDLGWSPDGKTLYVNEVADDSSNGRKLFPTRIRTILFR